MDNNISLKLSSIHLLHYYAHIHQVWGINTKMIYPLAASSVTTKQFQTIQSRSYPKVLASMGYNIYWHSPLRYSPEQILRSWFNGFRCWTKKIKIQIINKLLTHPKHKVLMLSIIDYFQLSTGITTSILYTLLKSIALKH